MYHQNPYDTDFTSDFFFSLPRLPPGVYLALDHLPRHMTHKNEHATFKMKINNTETRIDTRKDTPNIPSEPPEDPFGKACHTTIHDPLIL